MPNGQAPGPSARPRRRGVSTDAALCNLACAACISVGPGSGEFRVPAPVVTGPLADACEVAERAFPRPLRGRRHDWCGCYGGTWLTAGDRSGRSASPHRQALAAGRTGCSRSMGDVSEHLGQAMRSARRAGLASRPGASDLRGYAAVVTVDLLNACQMGTSRSYRRPNTALMNC